MAEPTCFVLMPFDKKKDPVSGKLIDFDEVYAEALRPAILAAGLTPLRGDQELTAGIIHAHFFQRLILAPFAVADLTTHNPNVFYEFGVRHAVKPRSTIAVSGNVIGLPFDVGPLRVFAYPLTSGFGRHSKLDTKRLPEFCEHLTAALAEAIRISETAANERMVETADSPIFKLITGFPVPDVRHLETDEFSARIHNESAISSEIAAIRARGVGGSLSAEYAASALDRVRETLLDEAEPDLVTLMELFLAYRAVEAWDQMVELYEAAPSIFRDQVLAREQYGMALNRVGEAQEDPARVAEALRVLAAVEQAIGPNSETSSLIGRVHKTRWQRAVAAGDPAAEGHLAAAIAAYRRGFEADHRDYYPGVNLCTLLVAQGEAGHEELQRIVPVVRYAAERRLGGGEGDYWDHATLLELAVLACDERPARTHLGQALAHVTDRFQPKTTANNLSIILANAPDPTEIAFAEEMIEQLRSMSRA